MKKLSFVAATLAIAGFASGAANAAGSATGSFNVASEPDPDLPSRRDNHLWRDRHSERYHFELHVIRKYPAKSTSFNVRCAQNLTYSVKLDQDTLATLGLNYTLGLSNTGTPALYGRRHRDYG